VTLLVLEVRVAERMFVIGMTAWTARNGGTTTLPARP
jgi:hypothetical protein